MNELMYTKEVTYIFNYGEDQHVEYHYVDNILNQRYRSFSGDITGRSMGAPLLNVKGTNLPHQVISPALVGERVYHEDPESGEKFAELMYFLPDINRYMKMDYMKEAEGGLIFGLINNVTLLPA